MERQAQVKITLGILCLLPLAFASWITVSNTPGVSLWNSSDQLGAMICAVNSSAPTVFDITKAPLGFTQPTTITGQPSACFLNVPNAPYLDFNSDLVALFTDTSKPKTQSQGQVASNLGGVICPGCKPFLIGSDRMGMLMAVPFGTEPENPDGTLFYESGFGNISGGLTHYVPAVMRHGRIILPAENYRVQSYVNNITRNMTYANGTNYTQLVGYKFGANDVTCGGDRDGDVCIHIYDLISETPIYQNNNQPYIQRLYESIPMLFTTYNIYDRRFFDFSQQGHICNETEDMAADQCITVDISDNAEYDEFGNLITLPTEWTAEITFVSNASIDPELSQSFVDSFSGFPWLNRTRVDNLGASLDAPQVYYSFDEPAMPAGGSCADDASTCMGLNGNPSGCALANCYSGGSCYDDMSTCNSYNMDLAGCYFHNCYPIGGCSDDATTCSLWYGDATNCAAAGCTYTGPDCVDDGGCTAINTGAACYAYGHCTWNGQCYDDSGCWYKYNPYDCGSYGHCYWWASCYDNYMCQYQTTQSGCTSYGHCAWTGLTVTKDDSINNHYGTIKNGVTWQPTGGHDGKGDYYFDGTGWIIATGYKGVTGTGDWTASVWAKTASSGEHELVGWGSASAGALDFNYFSIAPVGSGGVAWGVFQYDGCSGTTNVNDGNWHYLTEVMENHTCYIYVDGKLDMVPDDIPGLNLLPQYDFVVGTLPYAPGASQINGYLDDVQLFNRALTADEIRNIYNGTGSGNPNHYNGTDYIGKYAQSGNFTSMVFFNDTSTNWKANLSIASSSGWTTKDLCDSDANCTHYYPLDGNYSDIKGITDPTCSGDCPINATGVSSNAMWFDGTKELDFTGVPWGGLSAGSISTWFYSPIVPSYTDIISNTNLGADRSIIRLVADGSIYWIPAAGVSQSTSAGVFTFNSWHHVLMTWDNSVSECYLYIDGVQVDSMSCSSPSDSTGNALIAKEPSQPSGSGYWYSGALDDFLVYNDALSPSEVQQVFKAGLSQHATTNLTLYTRTADTYNISDLVAYYPLDGNTSDMSGNGYDGSAENGAASIGDGVVSSSYSFYGSDDYIDTGIPFGAGMDEFSASLWFKDTRGIGNGVIAGIDFTRSGNNADYVWGMYYDATNPTNRFWMRARHPDTSWVTCYSNNPPPVGKWVHLVMTFKKNDYLKFYQDGILMDQQPTEDAGTISGTSYTASFQSSSAPFIGCDIDDVRFYNRALGADEVESLYNLGNAEITDWSAWTKEGTVADGIPQTSTNSGKFFQFRTELQTDNTSVSPYLLGYSVAPSSSAPQICPNLWSGSGTNGDPCQVTECNYLAYPNLVYTLQQSITGVTGDCFILNASNVTFKGNGHTIQGDNSYNHNGIVTQGTVSNITIQDFVINNFGTTNSGAGIRLGQSIGTGPFVEGALVTNCNMSGNYEGIDNWKTDNVILSHNAINDSSHVGIDFTTGTQNTNITDNTLNNDHIGIYTYSASNIVIYGNIVTNCNLYGIDLAGTSNTVQNNILYGNSPSQIQGGEGQLIYNNSFGRILWTNDTFLNTLTVVGAMTFPGTITLSNDSAYLNDTSFAGEMILSNANISLYNTGLTDPSYVVLNDGLACSPSICTGLAHTGDNWSFSVSQWNSNYTIGAAPPAFGIGFQPPTPIDNKMINTTSVSINVSLTNNASSCILVWRNMTTWNYQENANSTGQIAQYLYMNYTKPSTATAVALWQVKHGKLATYNISLIGTSCWNAEPNQVELRIYSNANGGNDNAISQPYCWNGTGWMTIGNVSYIGNGIYSFADGTIGYLDFFDGNWTTFSDWDWARGNWYDNASVYGGVTNIESRVYEDAMWWNPYGGYHMDIHNADSSTWANYTVTGLQDAQTYPYYVWCNSSLGAENHTENRTLHTDFTPPTLSWNWADMNHTIGVDHTSPCVSGSETMKNCTLHFAGNDYTNTTNGTSMCFSVTGLSLGNHTPVSASCYDMVENGNSINSAWVYVQICGDGILTGSEQCEQPFMGCCNSGTCQFRTSSYTCRASVGVCDIAETCTGSDQNCPSDAFNASTDVCRASGGVCDVQETCTGSTAACPSDAKLTSQCRASAGVCDIADFCDGVNNNCPSDAFNASTDVCRASAGVCDLQENCTGSTASCPSDAKSTAQCRASAGPCDVAEDCNGVDDNCPTNDYRSNSYICDPGDTYCWLDAYCTGSSASCPARAANSTLTTLSWNWADINTSIPYNYTTPHLTTNREIDNCTLNFAGTPYINTTNSLSVYWYVTNLADGNHTPISAACQDVCGNTTSINSAWVLTDTIAPSLSWNWTDINTTIHVPYTNICVNASETLNICSYDFNGSIYYNTSQGTNLCYNITGIVNGNYTVNVSCMDLVGNTNITDNAWVNVTGVIATGSLLSYSFTIPATGHPGTPFEALWTANFSDIVSSPSISIIAPPPCTLLNGSDYSSAGVTGFISGSQNFTCPMPLSYPFTMLLAYTNATGLQTATQLSYIDLSTGGGGVITGSVCGDHGCTGMENCTTCPTDCGVCNQGNQTAPTPTGATTINVSGIDWWWILVIIAIVFIITRNNREKKEREPVYHEIQD